jgi:hypothetical protein
VFTRSASAYLRTLFFVCNVVNNVFTVAVFYVYLMFNVEGKQDKV